jgi:DNA primase
VGYAPRTWDALVGHLRGLGFTDAELTTGGLARQGQRGGLVDRFVGRLMWPIRDLSGDVVGFGARRLHDDDRIQAKYLNTAETPLFRKSTLLYGVDRAKKEIARRMQAVVVEGYTDVMACHLAGVPTAVATCGTAFGEEHVKVLRRLLMDQNEFRGEVVFTFDGDSAGQQAALRAFAEDQRFVTQTYVAVEPAGMDPCELRQHKGDAAVRDLVARRVPLFEFAIRSAIGRYDLDSPEGRGAARVAGMDVVRRIRDVSRRVDYARRLAGWLGVDENELVLESGGRVYDATGVRVRRPAPAPDDPALLVQREALKVAVQQPELAGEGFDALPAECFIAPDYATIHALVAAAGGCGAATPGRGWVDRLRAEAPDDRTRDLVTELAVEPLRAEADADRRYAAALLARLEELAATRRVALVKARLQRLNPVEHAEDYNRLFGELVAAETRRRTLRERAIGGL